MFQASQIISFLFLSVILAASAKKCNIQPASLDSFRAVPFDYLVVGGGTAGLALASRLAEDHSIQVGVIEAGIYHNNDPIIDVPANIGRGSGNSSYDWNFLSVPQPGANGRAIAPTRGKLLGGSSGMNFLAWNRASKPEYDAWGVFAPVDSWNWNGLMTYFKRTSAILSGQSNSFPGLPGDGSALDNDPAYVGLQGPVQVSYNQLYPDPTEPFANALNALGVPFNASPDNGTTSGLFNSRSSIDRSTGTRSYAPRYLCLGGSVRSNLHVLTSAQATKIILKQSGNNKVTATGVQFALGSQLFAVEAKREVILSAGAYQSPQLLELSGIGNKTLLESLGIPVFLDIPNVGENLQDHLTTSAQFQVKSGIFTLDELHYNNTLVTQQQQQYDLSGTGWLAAANSALAFLALPAVSSPEARQDLLQKFDHAVSSRVTTQLQAAQYKIQRKWLQDGTVPQLEFILFNNAFIAPAPNTSYIALPAIALHMVNRGSVHINTTNPLSPPVIDPKWLDNDFDVAILLEGLKFAQKIGQTAPLSGIIANMSSPSPDVSSETALINYIRNGVGSAQHPMGTLAMGPQSLGAVVDGQLLVYGTSNLRICDASIIPLSIGTHLQETVYAIAEKLADALKANH